MSLNIVCKLDNLIEPKNALISVSDKTGLNYLIPELLELCPEITIYSTGGTYKYIKEILADNSDKHLKQVSDYTGQPELQGGLVKTLDFKIYMGLLAESYNNYHENDMKRVNAEFIDLVIVNLYPFKETISKADVSVEMARGNIDIGGPCMIRAGAKNFLRVASVVDPSDYKKILKELKENNGKISLNRRVELAKKAFKHTSEYDSAIQEYLHKKTIDEIINCYEM